MKKMFAFSTLTIAALIAAGTMAIAQNPVVVSGSTTQINNAVVNQTNSAGYYGAGGGQISAASFTGTNVAVPTSSWQYNDGANGTARVTGSSTVNGSLTDHSATTFGNTQNTAGVAVYANNGYTAAVSGSGSMQTVAGVSNGDISNGAQGSTATSGAFLYAGNGPSPTVGNVVTGSGSTTGKGNTLIAGVNGGYSVTSVASTVSTSSITPTFKP
jgi:hypothetical protein